MNHDIDIENSETKFTFSQTTWFNVKAIVKVGINYKDEKFKLMIIPLSLLLSGYQGSIQPYKTYIFDVGKEQLKQIEDTYTKLLKEWDFKAFLGTITPIITAHAV